MEYNEASNNGKGILSVQMVKASLTEHKTWGILAKDKGHVNYTFQRDKRVKVT